MRLLIVGGNRFLGAELVTRALVEGHETTVLALDPPRAEVAPHVKWVKANRNDDDALRKGLAGQQFDAIVDNIAFEPQHVTGLLGVLRGRVGRYVLTSSVDTYRNHRPQACDEVADETLEPFETKGAPHDEKYLRGKRGCERALKTLEQDWSVVRPAMVIGRNDPLPPPPITMAPGRGIVGRALSYPYRVADGGPLLLRDDDVRYFHAVWVQDVARALLLATTHAGASRRAFNAVGDEVWTSERLVRALAHAAGSRNEIARVSLDELTRAGMADFEPPYGRKAIFSLSSNARLKTLGWSPTPAESWLPKLLEPVLKAVARPWATRRLQEIALAKRILRREAAPDIVRQFESSVAARDEIAPPPSPPVVVETSGRVPGGFEPAASRAWRDAQLGRIGIRPHTSHFREFQGGVVSSIGLGTHRGEPTAEDDALYAEAIRVAVRGGLNVLDTAINYRRMRSERVVGAAVRALGRDGVPRGALCIVTKGGFITSDADDARTPERYVRETYVETRLVDEESAKRKHSIAPRYIEASLQRSLDNLGLAKVDVFLLHNPERARVALGDEKFRDVLATTFAMLEGEARAGRIGVYGVATWLGLRVRAEHPEHVQLAELHELARTVGGNSHHFKAIEVPFSADRLEASARHNQLLDGRKRTIFDVAARLGLHVFTSASVRQGRTDAKKGVTLPPLPPPLGPVAASLQFARSAKGVGTALAGMRREAHVREALAVAAEPVFVPQPKKKLPR